MTAFKRLLHIFWLPLRVPVDIAHLGNWENFPGQLFSFLADRKALEGHWAVTNPSIVASMPERLRPYFFGAGPLARLWATTWLCLRAKKIIVHSAFKTNLLFFFFFNSWALGKTGLILWGGDLYAYRQRNTTLRSRVKEAFRRFFFRNVAQIFSATPGDGELCRSWYSIRGEYINIFTYPNSIVVPPTRLPAPDGPLRILLGNSADPSNDHDIGFEIIAAQDDGECEIHCPLAYGDPAYRDRVIQTGKSLFGERFFPIVDMVHFDQYLLFLEDIDLAIFPANRQQAMGTIRVLLGYGKKVFLKQGITSWNHLNQLGVRIFDLESFSLSRSFPETTKNSAAMQRLYSKEQYLRNLSVLFRPPASE